MKTIYNFLSKEDRDKLLSAVSRLTMEQSKTDDIKVLDILNRKISIINLNRRLFDHDFLNQKITQLESKISADMRDISNLKKGIQGSSRRKDTRLQDKIDFITKTHINNDTKELNSFKEQRDFLFNLGLSERTIRAFYNRLLENILKQSTSRIGVFFPEIAAFVIWRNRWCIATGSFPERTM